MYFLRDELKQDPDFIENNKADICASYQRRIVTYLLDTLRTAIAKYQVKDVAIAGGVSANSYLRTHFKALCEELQVNAHIPEFQYCTDNAGMIAIAAWYKFQSGLFAPQTITPFTRERFLSSVPNR